MFLLLLLLRLRLLLLLSLLLLLLLLSLSVSLSLLLLLLLSCLLYIVFVVAGRNIIYPLPRLPKVRRTFPSFLTSPEVEDLTDLTASSNMATGGLEFRNPFQTHELYSRNRNLPPSFKGEHLCKHLKYHIAKGMDLVHR